MIIWSRPEADQVPGHNCDITETFLIFFGVKDKIEYFQSQIFTGISRSGSLLKKYCQK
jgi:hypothetical protein